MCVLAVLSAGATTKNKVTSEYQWIETRIYVPAQNLAIAFQVYSDELFRFEYMRS